jgi:uncharacterized membrane-anchored protein
MSMPDTNSTQTLMKQFANKVPEITIFFWIIKILCTTVGETFADYINFNLNLGLTITSAVMSVALIACLIVQIRSKRYVAGTYWLAVVLLSIVGTLITDNLTDVLGFPLVASTAVFSVALTATFISWYASEKTLSIHSVRTRKREIFYWLAILFTFALGTAMGDLLAEKLNLGYLLSTGLFGLAIAAVATAHYRFKLNAIAAFWIAYILTRPLGASFGDFLSQPTDTGGLGLGTTGTSFIFLALISAIVIYLTTTRRDTDSELRPEPVIEVVED